MRCRWWNRWWHRRLRNIDRIVMSPIFERKALEHQTTTRSPQQLYHDFWYAFTHYPGQEHWLCECAREEQDKEGGRRWLTYT